MHTLVNVPENRFKMRPSGVVSKYAIVPFTTRAKLTSCSRREATRETFAKTTPSSILNAIRIATSTAYVFTYTTYITTNRVEVISSPKCE